MLSKRNIQLAIQLLNENKIVILPTDTIYGISALYDELNEQKINEIKKSSTSKKLIVLFSKFKQLKKIAKISKEFKSNSKSKEPLTQIIDGQNGPIALRKVKRKDLKKIINKVGLIFSTSVNYSGNNFLTKKEELDLFNIKISEIFWDGELKSKPSKIIDLSKNEIIRQ
ncbi:Sua5/YciO/YrdC/YwlC family protein [Spiroplasma cantharicola]|uniref:L-threonylcarbamoyladenylate synthase n=1 Tax=Spiroplasma cantharicola TaxID=362837 RepID=A0A0M4JTB8_9MOLU|nr:Sua5/YciO/YrdC/YwlC family protein [Spiroplasma cantharicola]ALD66771.1 tRNA threonylcarbamoyladenosine biosynthesis protein [Spiroplasma cantharicola]